MSGLAQNDVKNPGKSGRITCLSAGNVRFYAIDTFHCRRGRIVFFPCVHVSVHHWFCFSNIYGMQWCIFTRLFRMLNLGTKMNWFWRQKVKGQGHRLTAWPNLLIWSSGVMSGGKTSYGSGRCGVSLAVHLCRRHAVATKTPVFILRLSACSGCQTFCCWTSPLPCCWCSHMEWFTFRCYLLTVAVYI